MYITELVIIIFGAKAMNNSHFGAWVAVRVWGGMAAGSWLVTQDLTPSAPTHLESLGQKEQLNWALLWARAGTAGFAERTILTHLTLSKCWLAASPYQTWNVAGGSLMPNTLSNHNCWVQRLQVWLVWSFFSPRTWSFLLTLFNIYHGRPHFNWRKVCGFL